MQRYERGYSTVGRRVGALALVVMLAACTRSTPPGPEPSRPPATKATPAGLVVRTDREPIAKRFPGLGDFAEVHWQGKVLGEGGSNQRVDVPGPTDVSIKAVVKLRAEDFAKAKKAYEWAPPPSGWQSGIGDGLRQYAPGTTNWGRSDDYDRQVCTNAYGGTVYLELDTGIVYLNVTTG
jgi:hypothetical protein